MFGDKVHVISAVYRNESKELTVTAQSGDGSAALKLGGFPGVVPTVANGATTWKVPADVPLDEIVVTSNKGGVDTEDVVITGTEDAAVGVVANITADTTALQVGQTATLDGLASSGTVTSYGWSIASPAAGGTLTTVGTNGSSVTFKASTPGTYDVALTVTGRSNSDTAHVTLEVLGAAALPVADAGPDQAGTVPTSTSDPRRHRLQVRLVLQLGASRHGRRASSAQRSRTSPRPTRRSSSPRPARR